MLGEDGVIEPDHFAVGDFEAGFLEAVNDGADVVGEHGVGLDKYAGGFHKGVSK
jgi:hypothetical protein